MTPVRCLRRSSSSRTRSASRLRIAGVDVSSAPAGSIAAPGFDTAASAIRRASARENGGEPELEEAAHVEVVDDLVDQVAHVLDELGVALHVAGDAEAAEHLLAEAVRRGDRGGVEVGERARRAAARRRSTSSGGPSASRRTTASSLAAGARPSACSAETSRSRTRSRSSPVAIRVNVTSRSWCSGVPSAT